MNKQKNNSKDTHKEYNKSFLNGTFIASHDVYENIITLVHNLRGYRKKNHVTFSFQVKLFIYNFIKS